LDKRPREDGKAQKGAQSVKARKEKHQRSRDKNSPDRDDTRMNESRPSRKLGKSGQQQEQTGNRDNKGDQKSAGLRGKSKAALETVSKKASLDPPVVVENPRSRPKRTPVITKEMHEN
jgi:hypothetical protein